MEEIKKIDELKALFKETKTSLIVEQWGLGLLLLLGFILIILQLTNVINISWWVVLAPFYIPAIVVLAISGVICFVAMKTHKLNNKVAELKEEVKPEEKPIVEPEVEIKEEPKKKPIKKVKKNVKKAESKNVESAKGDTTDNK